MATQMNDTLIALNEPVGPYELHEALYEAFVATGHVRDFIFAPAMINNAPAVIVRGAQDGVPVLVPGATQESRFMLRAWPTVKLNGRPRSIAARPDKDGLRLRWLQRRAEEHGFELITQRAIVCSFTSSPTCAVRWIEGFIFTHISSMSRDLKFSIKSSGTDNRIWKCGEF